MKNTASFLISIIMVASSVTSCALLVKSFDQGVNFSSVHEPALDGPFLAPSEFKLGIESLTRSLQNIVCPFSKFSDDSYFELVEKFQSTFTKVSYRYLFFLQWFHDREEYLFLDLRKLII